VLIPHDVVPVLKEAMITLLRHTANPDTLRSIALHIASALHPETNNDGPSHDTKSTGGDLGPAVSGSSLGLIVLEAYTNFLCLEGVDNVHKFIKTVTNRVRSIKLHNV